MSIHINQYRSRRVGASVIAACLMAASGGAQTAREVRGAAPVEQHLPNAVLLTFPDSGHGSLFQFHESFTRQAAAFLASDSPFAPY